MNIFSILIVAIFCILGIGTSVVLIGYMIAVLAGKFYRKIRYGRSLFD